MQIIVVGAGGFGYAVASALYRKNDVTVIEKDEKACENIKQLDVDIIQGNGADVKILKKAGVHKAHMLVALAGIDEVNIIACLAAKLMTKNGIKTIARVSNPDYIDDKPILIREHAGIDEIVCTYTQERCYHSLLVREPVGINEIVCPELSLANEIHLILSVPSAIHVEDFVGGKVKMMEFKVNKGSLLTGKQLKDAHLPERCIVSAIFRDSELMVPHGDDQILPGDRAVIVGRPESLNEVTKFLGESSKIPMKILIVGGGTVGFYLADFLNKDGVKVTLLEIDKKKCEEFASKMQDVLVLNGDGTDLSLLKEENIGSMDALVAVTDSDEKNLLCALLGKQLGAKKVIARVHRPDYTRLFEIVGVDIAVSPIQATVNAVLKFTMSAGIESLVTVEGEKGKIIELTAKQGSKIINKKLKDCKFPKGAIVSVIVRKEDIIVPGGNDIILPEDTVVVFALPSAIQAVESLFK